MLKRKLILVLCIITMLATFTVSASALDHNGITGKNIQATIAITDPETGRVWESTVPAKDIDIQAISRTYSTNEMYEETVGVSIDAGEYILATLSAEEIESVLHSDITISTGMSYVVSGANVKITSVFGSTVPKGFYYATDREQYYRHPGTGAGNTWYPSSNSWRYTTDSGYGLWMVSLPPKAILDCTVRISDMSAYRDISVTCTL